MKLPEQTTICGDTFWSEDVLSTLRPYSINGNTVELYEDSPKSFYQSLVKSAQEYGNKTCIIDDSGRHYTYSQLLDMVDGFSKKLYYNYKVYPGTRVGLLMYNTIGFCVSFYAINKLNAISVPLSTKYRESEILPLIEKASVSGLIYDIHFTHWFADDTDIQPGFLLSYSDTAFTSQLTDNKSLPDIPDITSQPSDTAIIMFTSGTTSYSKGVMMTNYNTMHAINVYKKIFCITPDDITLIPVPIYHVTGLIGLLGLFLSAGGCVILHKFFDARRILRDVSQYEVTFIHAAPTVFSMLLEQKNDFQNLASLRLMACGSSNMPAKKIQELKEWIPQAEFRTVYGLTETSSPATIFPCDVSQSPYIGSSGQPVPGTIFKIVSEDNEPLPFNRVGTILIKGSVVTPGYYIQKPFFLEDGWLDTGDLGYFNEEGYLYIVDRKKDMINRGGEKVCSIDVENTLYDIPDITEAAVVGIPNEKYGEVPAAMICLKEGSTLNPDKLHMILKEKLASFQIPAFFLITDSLPLTPNSKIDKKKIRQLLSQNFSNGGKK